MTGDTVSPPVGDMDWSKPNTHTHSHINTNNPREIHVVYYVGWMNGYKKLGENHLQYTLVIAGTISLVGSFLVRISRAHRIGKYLYAPIQSVCKFVISTVRASPTGKISEPHHPCNDSHLNANIVVPWMENSYIFAQHHDVLLNFCEIRILATPPDCFYRCCYPTLISLIIACDPLIWSLLSLYTVVTKGLALVLPFLFFPHIFPGRFVVSEW